MKAAGKVPGSAVTLGIVKLEQQQEPDLLKCPLRVLKRVLFDSLDIEFDLIWSRECFFYKGLIQANALNATTRFVPRVSDIPGRWELYHHPR